MTQIHPELFPRDIEILFDIMDQDGNGSISFLEFTAATIDPREVDIREMNQAFRLLDKDQKGYLVKEDLYRLLSTENDHQNPLGEDISMSMSPPGHQYNPKRVLSTLSLDTTADEVHFSRLKVQEAERLTLLHDRVEKIMGAADVNGDGVIR
jgi:hypothetical protein